MMLYSPLQGRVESGASIRPGVTGVKGREGGNLQATKGRVRFGVIDHNWGAKSNGAEGIRTPWPRECEPQ
jgi:hypothetical protein